MTTKDQKYNGWTNYETWCIALWTSNDQGSSEWASELAQSHFDDAKADGTFTKKERATLTLAEYLKDYFEDSEQCPLLAETNLYADLLRAALGSVNWHEWAENLLEDINE